MRSYLEIVIVSISIMTFTADCGEVVPVYSAKGNTVHLSLTKHQNLSSVRWRKDDKPIAIIDENQKPQVQTVDKYEINISDGSLVIKNLTLHDAGVYKAVTGVWEDTVSKYQLIVHEAVSEPLIEAELEQQSNISNACRILIKCSADGDWVKYSCNLKHCTPTNISVMRINITVNIAENGVLECVASNNFTTKRTSLHLENTCSEINQESSLTTYIILIIVLCFLIVLGGLMSCIIIKLFLYAKKKGQNEGTHQEAKDINTLYSVVCKPSRTETAPENSAAQNSPTTVYDVPSKCVMAPQDGSGGRQENDEQTTVYWKLGQK